MKEGSAVFSFELRKLRVRSRDLDPYWVVKRDDAISSYTLEIFCRQWLYSVTELPVEFQ